MLAMAWLLALVFSIPNSFVYQLKNGKCEPYYMNNPSQKDSDQIHFIYEAYVATLTFLLPLVTMLGCYTSMVVHLYRRSKTTLGQQGAGWAAEAKVKTVKITFVLALGFVICWTPYSVMILWSYIDLASASSAQGLWYYAEYFGCVNNCLNPLFYGMVGKKWISRKKFFGKRKKQDLTENITTTETPETKTSVV